MKHFILCLGILFLLNQCKTSVEQNVTTVKGTITNPTSDKIYIYKIKNYIDNKYTTVDSGIVDSTGNFLMNFKWDTPQWITFVYNRENIDIYLQPQDNLLLSFNADSMRETITFDGKGAIINNYYLDKSFDFIVGYEHYVKSLNEYNYFIDSLREVKYEFLEDYFGKSFSKDKRIISFINLEKQSIYYEWANYKVIYAGLHEIITNDTSFKLEDNYYDFIKPIDYSNDDAFNLESYRSFITNLMFRKSTELMTKDTTLRSKNHLKIDIKIAENNFKGKVQEYLIANIIFRALNDGPPMKGPQSMVMELFNKYKTTLTNEAYIKILENTYKKVLGFQAGNPAPDFTLTDIEGNKVTLSDFRGKVVYLDFWASWCGPCMREMPYSKELQEYFKDKEVAFVFISTDKDRTAWKNKIKEKELTGIQLIVTKKVKEAYNISSIPHYVLIDREGNIVNYQAERPSEGAKKEIELLLK